jgi:hypothetical protein
MAGAFRDIAFLEQVALVDVRIEFALAVHVVDPLRPAHEMRHRALRAVAVKHLQPQSARRQVTLHRDKRTCRRRR